MLNKIVRFTRKKRTITDHETKEKMGFEFINEAKRHSRKLQWEHDKGLGFGCLIKRG